MKHDEKEMPLWEHLEELRWTLIKILTSITISTIFCLYFVENLIQFLLSPSNKILSELGVRLNLSGPFDAFWVKLKTGLLTGIIIASPVIIYFTWQFISPALREKEKKNIIRFTSIASILFLSGVSLAYISIPYLLYFSLKFMIEGVENIWLLSDFISFCMMWILLCGAISQTPILILALVSSGIVKTKTFRNSRPYAIVIIFIIAALLTPPDPISQIILALPLVILFEISIFIAKFAEKK